MLVPAHLIIGTSQAAEQQALTIMCKQFCKTQQPFGTCFCVQCKMISNHQHPQLIWIHPEKNYTVDDLEVVFDKIKFALDDDEHFYFVLAKADALTDATANRLLKILEEPPRGYHFLLLAQNEELLLPTIKSRCTLEHLANQSLIQHIPPLLKMFMQPARPDPLVFESELKAADLDDRTSILLFEQLVAHYQEKFIHSAATGADHADLEQLIEYLLDTSKRLPQSGSSTIFWKRLYLTFPFQERV